MPSTMTHLMLANKVYENFPIEFFIGSIAPDAIAVREDYSYKVKDKLHFRTSNNPLKDLESLAKEIDIAKPYCEGYILHLFFDAYWDRDCLKPFREKCSKENWVHDYRLEISKASAWLYHNDNILRKIWNDMINYKDPILENVQGITYEEILRYYESNHSWFNNFNLGESTAYPNAFIDEYTNSIAQKYVMWKQNI